jgi:hypothetical protein
MDLLKTVSPALLDSIKYDPQVTLRVISSIHSFPEDEEVILDRFRSEAEPMVEDWIARGDEPNTLSSTLNI